MASFLVFNWFRLVVGVTFDWSCDRNVTEVVTADFDPEENTVLFKNAQVAVLISLKAMPCLKDNFKFRRRSLPTKQA